MERKTKIIIGLGIWGLVILIVLILALSSSREKNDGFTLPETLDASECPSDMSPRPVILISMDGFKPEYVERGATPILKMIMEKGVSTPYMVPIFPSLTFPNHYTIVTGLYAEAHGIIANHFYDPGFNATFSYKKSESREGRWWNGEPIWNTLRKNNMMSATYFWVGSEAPIGGHKPTYWYPFDSATPINKRVKQVLDWLQLPASKRPSWISLYTNEPDRTGHRYGPDSNEVTRKITEVDNMLKTLLQGLIDLSLLPCVNIIIVSDHGMTSSGVEKYIDIKEGISEEIWENFDVSVGPVTMIRLKDEDQNSSYVRSELEKAVSCNRDEYRVFRREELPRRFHYSRNERIGDYVLILDEGYNSGGELKGMHGYDNQIPSMQALFVAYGPDFKIDFEALSFQNIELYNLMCHLLNVTPAANNGTGKLLYSLLNNPPSEDEIKNQVTHPIPIMNLVNKTKMKENYLASNCPGNEFSFESTINLINMSTEEMTLTEKNIHPWGLPRYGFIEENATLLFHPEHITGYSLDKKMPLWTSFIARKKLSFIYSNWTSDPRLTLEVSQPCFTPQDDFPSSIFSFMPIFPPEYSFNQSTSELCFLTSNAMLFHVDLKPNWSQLMMNLIPKWLQTSNSPFSVIVGPIFDPILKDYMDDEGLLSEKNITTIPTEYFAIVFRCRIKVEEIKDCPVEFIDAIAYIYPQRLEINNCFKNPEEFAKMFRVKIQDIEHLTQLKFFTNLKPSERLEFISREFQNSW